MISSIPITLLSVETESYHLSIPASMEGRPIHMLVDTGASRTVFDEGRFRIHYPDKPEEDLSGQDIVTTGIGTNSLEISMVKLKNLSIGDWYIRNYKAILMDLSHVNKTYMMLGLPPIDGILGSDLLLKLNSLIDYRTRNLTIRYRKKSRPI